MTKDRAHDERCPHIFEFASPQGGIRTGRCVKPHGHWRRHRDNDGNEWRGRDRLWSELGLPSRKREGWAVR